MAVHRCREVESTTNRPAVSVGLWSFWERSGDLKHHKYRNPQSDEQLVNIGSRTLEAYQKEKHQV